MSIAAPGSRLVSAAHPDRSAAALAARHGPSSDRPALRRDLVIRRQVQVGEVFWLVKNPETQKLYSLSDAMWQLVSLFDGTRTRTQIAAEYNRRHPGEDIDLALVLNFEEQLRDMACLAQSVAERNLELLGKLRTARRRAAEEKAEGFNPFFIQFHVVDPDAFMNRTVRYVKWLWSPPVVALVLVLYAVAIGVIVRHFGTIWAQTLILYNFFGKPFWDAVQFFFILTCIGCVHEYAHGYVCKMYGGEVHDIGMALLYFTPAFYCDTTDALLFENRWRRLWVTTAGIYVEGIMCTIATGLWVASYPDTLLHELAYKSMLFTGISTVFFNINPLIKIDGYYALTHLVEDPNLREGAFQYLGAWIQRHILRLRVEVPLLPRRKRRLYAGYGVLASVYAAFVMVLIGKLFSNLYHRYFPDVAGALLAVTLYQIFKKRARVLLRVGRLFYLDKKEYLMSRAVRRRLSIAAGFAAALFVVPWARRTIEAPVALAPERTFGVRAPQDATVAGVEVSGGQEVAPGDVLFRLASVAQSSRVAELRARRDRLLEEAERDLEADRPAAGFQARQQIAATDAAIAREEAGSARLTVRSPGRARVLTPHPEDLLGRAVASGEILANLAACGTLRAEIPVTERLRSYLAPGEPVFLQLRASPMRPKKGVLVSIAPAPVGPPAPAAGATPIPDVPTKFIAAARFDNADGRLLPGMTGTAEISLGRSSYAVRAFDGIRRWVGTVVWQ